MISVLAVTLYFVPHRESLTATDIYNNCLNNFVEIKAENENIGTSYGTGEIITSDGRIITNDSPVTANARTVELSSSAIDVQSVFDEFEDATLSQDGNTIYFEGFKSLDGSALSEIDYISDVEIEELEACRIGLP